MSIVGEILDARRPVVSVVRVNKSSFYHGENAVEVIVDLYNGKRITGTFTTEQKSAFGGVEFSSQKDIPKLMISKIDSVLRGTADD